jgi:hypothetical protein
MWRSLWSRAGNSHILRRALRLAPATSRGPQPHPAGGCGQVQQVTPRSAGAKKANVSSLEFECIQRTSGEGDFTSRASTWRPRSRFIGAMETTPKTMALECFPEGKHSQQVRTCSSIVKHSEGQSLELNRYLNSTHFFQTTCTKSEICSCIDI